MSTKPETTGKVKFTEKYAELWKFIKFSIVGFSSSAIEYGVYLLLQFVVFVAILENPMPDNWFFNFVKMTGLAKGIGYFYAYVISTTIGYIIAFILNRKTTFKADSNVVLSTFLYILMVIFTIFMTAWLGTMLQNFMTSKNLGDIGKYIGKLIVMALATAWTYPINRFVIHRHKKETPAEESEAAATEE